ncbi:MAG: hypothetical protein KAU89_03585 [Candidatus Thorarchaeota archaeon]|nr:hypothetical protein [Candidatus Thorarchaeota archaeon]
MVGKLGVQEFMVITAGGLPIFHYSRTNVRKMDSLLSGFLSAITSFATEFGERSIRSLTFEGSELLYEQFNPDFLFIFLVDNHAPKRVLRAVLRELSRKFMATYETELRMEIPILDVFEDFRNEVQGVFQYYEGVLIIISNLSAYVIPTVRKEVLDVAIRTGGFLDELHRDFGSLGARVLTAIDGISSIHSITNKLNIEEDATSEVIEYLAIRGVLRIAKMCPVIEGEDARFNAFLDLVGLPSKEYQLLERAKHLCNGERSVVDVSERLGVTANRLYEVLAKLGTEVNWNYVEVSGLADEPTAC